MVIYENIYLWICYYNIGFNVFVCNVSFRERTMTYTELYRVLKKLNIVDFAGHLYFDHVDVPKNEIGRFGKDFVGNYGVKPNGGCWVHEEGSAERALQRAIVNLKEKENNKELEKIKGDFV